MRYLPFDVPFTEDLERNHLDFAREILDALEATFNGRGVAWKFSLPPNLPAFTREVLSVVSRIPRGYVTTYGEIAKAISESNAARAVARAVASNPFLLLIPCHRVVKSNLEVGGYVLGENMKRTLLKREANRDLLDRIIFYYKGRKLRLNSTWKIWHKM
jgi:O-6-methylguanine DNA methyltransferase